MTRVLDPGFFLTPHTGFAELREQASACRVVVPPGLAVWVVTRYAEARAALTDPKLTKTYRPELFERHAVSDAAKIVLAEDERADMLNLDPPAHTRMRRLVSKAFTPARVAALRPRIEEITGELLDELDGLDEADLIESYASPVPTIVISELLGVPAEDRAAFRGWADVVVSAAGQEEFHEAGRALSGYLAELVEHKREHPADDLITALVQQQEADDRLTPAEVLSTAALLLVAGHETTVNLIGNSTLALLRNPGQLAELRADPALLPAAIEEFLRYDGPLTNATFRFTSESVQVGEVTIPADEIVLVSLGSANRDATWCTDADRLDVTRVPGGHLAFGHGVHYCLGAPLARLEGEIALRGLLARFPGMKLAAPEEELRWRPSVLMHGLLALPVRLR